MTNANAAASEANANASANALARLRAWWSEPNPLVRKELLALLRTPLYTRFLFVALVAVALSVMAFALVASDDASNTAALGSQLFQLFFSLTFFFITVMGATLGAVSVTQEREGRTLDGLVLSAMGPARLAAGKLVAVLLATALVPAAAMPVLGVAFLFGGVSVAHLCVASLYVAAFGSVAVAFGVAVSAQAAGTRQALIASVPVATVGTMMLGATLTGMGEVFSRQTQLSMQGPLFFVDAYLALPFDRFYVVALVLAPLYVVGSALALAFALARSGLTDETDDRAAPVKRWALWSVPAGLALTRLLLGVAGASVESRARAVLAAQCLLAFVGVALAAFFAGEPPWRTARMQHAKHAAGALRGLAPPGALEGLLFAALVCGFACVVAPWAGLGFSSADPTLAAYRSVLAQGGLWVLSALLVCSGLTAALRFRPAGTGVTTARVGLALWLLFACVIVWLVALLVGAVPENSGNLLVAMSPFFAAGATSDALQAGGWRGSSGFWLRVVSGAYALAGVALFAFALRARERYREHERARFAEPPGAP